MTTTTKYKLVSRAILDEDIRPLAVINGRPEIVLYWALTDVTEGEGPPERRLCGWLTMDGAFVCADSLPGFQGYYTKGQLYDMAKAAKAENE